MDEFIISQLIEQFYEEYGPKPDSNNVEDNQGRESNLQAEPEAPKAAEIPHKCDETPTQAIDDSGSDDDTLDSLSKLIYYSLIGCVTLYIIFSWSKCLYVDSVALFFRAIIRALIEHSKQKIDKIRKSSE